MRITAILASHNRRTNTLESLESFFAQDLPPMISLTAVLVDDGSSDGTGEAVRRCFPSAEVISGTGNLFWARAMAIAEGYAECDWPDHLLWLNDDVILDSDALSRLLVTAEGFGELCMVVGALRDAETSELTYSGLRRRGLHPLSFEHVEPRSEPQVVLTFNGNVVLVPRSARARIGPIDGGFRHATADLDYGLRAAARGIHAVLAPATVGSCPRNLNATPWKDSSLSTVDKTRALIGPKGIPPGSTARFLRRHGGFFWPVFFLSSYIRFAGELIEDATRSVIRRRGTFRSAT